MDITKRGLYLILVLILLIQPAIAYDWVRPPFVLQIINGTIYSNIDAQPPYLYNSSSQIFFNESKLNETVDARAIAISDTNESARFNNLMGASCDTNQFVDDVLTNGSLSCSTPSGATDTNESTRVDQLVLSNISIDSRVDTLEGAGYISTDFYWTLQALWFTNASNTITFNEAKLNSTIANITDDRDADTQNDTDYYITSGEVSGTTTKTIEIVIGDEAISNNSFTFTDLVNHTDFDTLYTEDSPYLTLVSEVFGFDEAVLNNTIEEVTASTTYLPYWVNVTSGTLDSGNLSSIQNYNNDYLNITEGSGASPLTVIINFTDVLDIDQIIIRAHYAGSLTHDIAIGIYDTDLNDYEEGHGFIYDSDNFQFVVQPVFDSAVHIIGGPGGEVSIRLRHVQNGITSHDLFLDYVIIVDGMTSLVSSGDSTCDGDYCVITNAGTLDGYEGADLLDDTNESARVDELRQDNSTQAAQIAALSDTNTWNTTQEMRDAVNGTQMNATLFYSIDCDLIDFDNGIGSSAICDGVDAGGSPPTSYPATNITPGTLGNGSYIIYGNLSVGNVINMPSLDNTSLLVANGSVYFSGTKGDVPNQGAGTRFMWIPSKAAIRAGLDTGNFNSTIMANIGIRSTAFGEDPIASGGFSVAMGDYPIASGQDSVALGYFTRASGDGSIAIGYTAEASGNQAVAFGNGNDALGYAATSFGGNAAKAYADYAIAMGYQVIASGDYSTAMGREIESSGKYSIAIALNDQNGANLTANNTMAIMGGNVTIGTLTQLGTFTVNGNIIANDWGNVTLNEAQVLDLTHTTDTNESTRVTALITQQSNDNSTQATLISAISSITDTNESTRVDQLILSNISIDSRVDTLEGAGYISTDFYWTLQALWFTNASNTITFNEAKMNSTIRNITDTRDTNTWNTTTDIRLAINGSNVNGTNFQSIPCSSLVFDTGIGSASICDGVDTTGAGASDGNNYTSSIDITGTTTKQLEIARFGMINLTTTWTDLVNHTDTTIPDTNESTRVDQLVLSNTSIDSRVDTLEGAGYISTDFYWTLQALWFTNASNTITFNEAKMNATMVILDTDTHITSLPAANITAGTFGAGDFAFAGKVNITNDLNMTNNNITTVDCISFKSGGQICSG